jgi:hypothetical protein
MFEPIVTSVRSCPPMYADETRHYLVKAHARRHGRPNMAAAIRGISESVANPVAGSPYLVGQCTLMASALRAGRTGRCALR